MGEQNEEGMQASMKVSPETYRGDMLYPVHFAINLICKVLPFNLHCSVNVVFYSVFFSLIYFL